jgi:hypothetical protein
MRLLATGYFGLGAQWPGSLPDQSGGLEFAGGSERSAS